MSRQVTYTSAVTVNPTGFTSTGTIQNGNNGCANSASTNYATLSGTTAQTTYYTTYSFSPQIPQNATINSVVVYGKYRVYRSGYPASAATYSNTTQKSTLFTLSSQNDSSFVVSGGSWTSSEVSSLGLRLYHPHGNRNARYLRFYGADAVINYTLTTTEYSITLVNTSSEATTNPDEEQYVIQGNSQVIKIFTEYYSDLTITDNNVNVKNSLVNQGNYYTYTISNISADHVISIGETPGTYYTINASSTYTSATVSPSTQQVKQGRNATVNIDVNTLREIIVKDNGVNVTSSVIDIGELSFSKTHTPSEYIGSNGTVENPEYGLEGTGNTIYSQLLLRNGTYMEYSFDTSNIPSDVIITSISCQVKGCVTRTSNAATVQLYAGSTAKGSATNLNTNSNASVIDLDCGSWTVNEFSNIKVRIASTYTNTSNYYARFYGATLVVNYTNKTPRYIINNVQTSHTITIEEAQKYTVSSYAVYENSTISPQSETDYLGYDITFRIDVDDIANVIVKDNGVNVNSSLVHVTEETYSQAFIPSEFIEGSGSTQNTQNGLSDTSSTTYAQTNGQSGHYLTYGFDCSSIPQNATINSVSCLAKVQHTRTSSNSGIVQLYSGNNEKGSASSFGNTITTVSLNTGTWTRDELENIKIRIGNNYNGGTTSYYTRFYGAELTVTYTVQDDYYSYTIQNVTTNHTVAVRPNKTILKLSGTWTDMKGVYVKVNGSWVKQTDFSAVFDPNGIYVLKN